MELTIIDVGMAMGIVSLGALVQGTIGFGLAIVAAPLLYRINPVLVPTPIIIAALVMQNESGNRIRANLSAFFALGGALSLIVLGMGGLLTKEILLVGVSFVPAVRVGSWLATKIVGYVNQETIRKALLFLCSLSGMVAIHSAISR